MHDEMMTYGLKQGTQDTFLHIDSPDVPKGKNCGCICPNCKQPLFARRGNKKQHHFAHAPKCKCGNGRMTTLHMQAQKILEDRKTILLPAYRKQFVHEDSQTKTFSDVKLEKYENVEGVALRPDCVCRQEEAKEPLWVEIWCRHKVDETKREEIISRQKYCVEIDFRDLLNKDYKEEDIINRLESDASHKEWICCPAWDKKEEQELLRAKKEWEEQQRKEAEERQQELERIKKEREYEDYLDQLAIEWRSNPDQKIVNQILQEIRTAPYDSIINMYTHLVPGSAWAREYTRFPRNDKGLQVFYCLIRYYYSYIRLDDRTHTRWKVLDTPMWMLINQGKRTEEENILLEYMIVIWAINLLNNHKRYQDPGSELVKIFSKQPNVRKGLIDIMKQGGDRNRFLEEDVRKKIHESILGIEDGETIFQIFSICFPQHQNSKRKQTVEKEAPVLQPRKNGDIRTKYDELATDEEKARFWDGF